LSASDYALLDEHSNAPRPNFWAAVLWKRIMGTTVLAPPTSPEPNLRIYAHCARQGKGGVSLVALNIGNTPSNLPLLGNAKAWMLGAAGAALDTKDVLVNGRRPTADDAGRLQGLEGQRVSGSISVPARSIAFVTVAGAHNPACQ
ncbi:MAG: hypothetical protein ABW128_23995, partial [Rhizorhabdus sp.]